METAHLIPYFLALFCYGADFLFRVFGEGGKPLHRSFFGAAFFLHTIFLALRWRVTGHAPFVGMFESVSFYLWSTALVSLILSIRKAVPGEKGTLFLSGYCALFSVVGALSPKAMVPKIPVLDTRWFEIHVALSFVSYAYMTVTLPYLLSRGFREKEEQVEALAFYGFTLFSAGMVAGGIWAYFAWGSYWIWTPKEVFSAVLWVYYGTLLHAKMVGRFSPEVRRGLYALGYGIMMFTYLGVSLLLKSSHSFR
ncbi:MAG: hypothetical protein D6713_02390 [Deltaproteobacteria bacterium]|nr:MAG: hypothetical protein D6713_02390 [Deltaproteobacteria bacterium]